MDPLSITTGVLSLVGTGIKAVQTFQSLAAKYSLADLTIVSIRTECSSIRLALSQIKSIIAREPNLRDAAAPEESGDEMWEEYTVALDACSITFNILSDRLTKLKMDEVGEYNEATAKSKIRAVMNSEEMGCLVQNIRGQAQALTLLLQVFQTASTRRTQLLRQERNSVILHNVSENARSLVGSIRRSATISSGFSIQNSVIGDEEFDFDDEVVNSRAYRRILARHRARNSSIVSDDVERNEDRHHIDELADDLEHDEPEGTQFDREREPEISEHGSLWIDPHPTDGDEGEEDWTEGAESPAQWENPRAAPKPPGRVSFEGESVDEPTIRPILPDSSQNSKARHRAAVFNPGMDLDWPLPRNPETGEFPNANLGFESDQNTQGSTASHTSLSSGEMDAEKERVLENFVSRVEDWKNYDLKTFGELVLWGKYKISARDRTRTFLTYLFENIVICCREVKPPQEKAPKRTLDLFLRKKPTTKGKLAPEPVPEADPDAFPLRLTGRVFMRNITDCIHEIHADDTYNIRVVWKVDRIPEDFTIWYDTEEEMMRWVAEFTKRRPRPDAPTTVDYLINAVN